jgi:hypothetical protein
LSYGYWMREGGWSGRERLVTARVDLLVSFSLVLVFCLSMIFLSTQVEWRGAIMDEGPRLCLMLADRIGAEIGQVGRAVFLIGFWGAAFSSVLGVWHGVPFLFDDWIHLWRRQKPSGQRGLAYRGWALYLTLAAISALVVRRSVWIVFVYTVVGALFFPYVISTLLWLNNSRRLPDDARNGWAANLALGVSLLLFTYLAIDALLPRVRSALAWIAS